MKIVSYEIVPGEVAAATLEEWRASDAVRDAVGAHEWVWQDVADRETAIARHYDAHAAWEADLYGGKPERDTY